MTQYEKEFVNGVSAKEPSPKAPDYIKAKVNIKLSDFAEYLRELKKKEPDVEWLNLQVSVSQAGKWYVERDKYKPQEPTKSEPEPEPEPEPASGGAEAAFEDDIPFAPYMKGTVA